MKYILLLVILVVSCHPAIAHYDDNAEKSIDAAFEAARYTCQKYSSDDMKKCMREFGLVYGRAFDESTK